MTNSILMNICKILTINDLRGKSVIEIGSKNVNGTVRPIMELLEPRSYVGVDIEPGDGVDLICSMCDLINRFGKNNFDVAISTCLLEHIKNWQEAVSNLKHVVKEGGLIIVAVPHLWEYHGHPCDYWRFTSQDLKQIFSDCTIEGLIVEEGSQTNIIAKIRKPLGFIENNLASYQLKSINTTLNRIKSFLKLNAFRLGYAIYQKIG